MAPKSTTAAWVSAVAAVASAAFALRACSNSTTAQRFAEMRDRPRMSIETIDLMTTDGQPAGRVEPNREHIVRVKFANKGALNADHARTNGTWQTMLPGTDCPRDAAYPVKTDGPAGDVVVGPGSPILCTILVEKLSEANVERIRKGELLLAVRGQLLYEGPKDAGEASGQRHYKFCLIAPRDGRDFKFAYSSEE